MTGGVPTLVLRGALDPYSAPLGDVAAATAGAAKVYPLEIPNQSYNVLGYTECPRAIRNAWIDSPTAPPDTSCLTGIAPPQLAPQRSPSMRSPRATRARPEQAGVGRLWIKLDRGGVIGGVTGSCSRTAQ